VLAAVLVAAAPVIVWRETLANTDALAWAALCVVLAVSAGVPRGEHGGNPVAGGE
jgi:hypothetical protein